ncbi:hypothetical protein [Actinoplanes friuliensis]|uniref:hypothetical protein n=1 Tax=Actinoplanes friuliensis TaxID=196914 RepID=UPI0003F61B8A|nr:hypothetical protein [Actinoplanes friuliensis]
MNELLVAGPALAGGYLALTGTVALIASAHPDEKRRRDAARILDRLLRVRQRDRP